MCAKVTMHARRRIHERFLEKNRCHNSVKLFKNALNYGYGIGDFKESKIKQYMCSHRRKNNIKIYNGYVFIYSKNNKTLYTVWKVPDIYMDYEKELKKQKKK